MCIQRERHTAGCFANRNQTGKLQDPRTVELAHLTKKVPKMSVSLFVFRL